MNGSLQLDDKKFEELFSYTTHRHLLARPPKVAYMYFPSDKCIVELNEKNPLNTLRRIFEGAVDYSPFEKEKIQSFLNHITESNNNSNLEEEKFKFPDFWIEANTLRCLQSYNYDFKITLNSIISFLAWSKEFLPVQPTNNICEILNIGFIYSHGRDSRFRPILVIRVKDFKKNYEKYAFEDWLNSIIYLIEYIINHILIKGQIENWNLLCDCENASI